MSEDDHKKAPKDTILGRVIGGKYPVVGLIGQGGMGAVYKALQEPVGREVALKVIRNFGDESNEQVSETLRARFFREARVVAKLSNPAAVTLYDYGAEDDGVMYMVLELVKGRPVSHVIRDEGPMSPGRARDICCQVLNALAEAHGLGLVHRDLKPDNIMLVKGPWGEEQAKVLDFGIAKVKSKEKETLETGTGLLLGTPLYMPPEQAMSRGAEARSDLYSLGVVLYEMLTGGPPFTAATVFEVLLAHREKPVPDIPPEYNVPPALEAVVKRAMAKTPEERFADAAEMAQALVDAVPLGSDTAGGATPARMANLASATGNRTPLPVAVRQSNSLLNSPTQAPSTRTPLPPAVRRSGPGALVDPNSPAGQKAAQKVSAAGVRKSHAEVHHSANGASVSVRAPVATPDASDEDLAGTALRATPRPIAEAMARPQTPRPVTVLPQAAEAELAMTAPPATPSPVAQANPQWSRAESAAVKKGGAGLKIALAIVGMLVLGGGAGGTMWYLNSRSQAAVKGLNEIPPVPDPVTKPDVPAKLPDTPPAKPADPTPDKPAVAEPPKTPDAPAVAEAGPDASVPAVAAAPTPDPKPHANATPDPKPDPKPLKAEPKVAKPKVDPGTPKVAKPKPAKQKPGMRQVEEGGYKAIEF